MCIESQLERELLASLRSGMLSQMVLVLWNILPYMALLFNVIQSEEFSIVLERELLIDREPPFELIYREPPVENDGERDDGIEEHFITQRLDNFDHQNNGTFQMVQNSV